MVKVACTALNGLTICKWKPGYDDGTGDNVKTVVRDGLAIRLNGPSSVGAGVGNSDGKGLEPGITEIPDDWGFDTWLKQNEHNPFVKENFVYLVKDDGPNAPTA
jgi:hypothetical protein